ncbi:phage terminase small subunit [Paenibacillus sp. ACRRX]|uniref:phage terminase small subunit n=1 Tax=Paenibacillus sp. ACRRX TaxID=2918206 RepID=UPI001EF73373|nr:phage terminase small subunit [Paenibacillus sp. ACRRX]MCG7406769.1 phage terminase small subunit [Paenibacillus sp. ACRRX]
MMDKHILAEQDYMQGLKYKEIADKYDVTLNTVKSWKQRHGWQRNKGAPDEKGVHTNRRGAPEGNQNALGNDGGAPKGNSNAVTHGFFRKYLPNDTAEIMEQIAERLPIDMLWDQIMIQYAAILRAQQIMFVESKSEMIKELKKAKYKYIECAEEDGDGYEKVATEEEYEFQFAWDRHATYLSAQSRAMSELRSLIRQYEDMCRQGNADKEQQLRIKKLKGEVAVLEQKATKDNSKPIEITIKRAAKSDTDG